MATPELVIVFFRTFAPTHSFSFGSYPILSTKLPPSNAPIEDLHILTLIAHTDLDSTY
ncbi:hypothetical protein EK21DRAFT_115634 [Setomelanomma holmii]|uniref:Uncharacterized protein n=1 Tax=Setomelanomma holmii TaxID=210430 RepID=A0A9P4H1D0_9PLEO|nr:hypothetical protein EK21DRAFT_115634 [Setomelanomma holmii]